MNVNIGRKHKFAGVNAGSGSNISKMVNNDKPSWQHKNDSI